MFSQVEGMTVRQESGLIEADARSWNLERHAQRLNRWSIVRHDEQWLPICGWAPNGASWSNAGQPAGCEADVAVQALGSLVRGTK